MLHVSSNKFSKTFRTRRSLENVLFSESSSILVSRKRDKEIDMRSCLSKASSSNDYENRTFGLRAQDVFAPFFVSFLSVMKEMKVFLDSSRQSLKKRANPFKIA